MLYTANGQLAVMILEGISSKPERDIYLKRRGGSGVKLLGILYAECDKLNSESQIMIVDEIATLSARVFEFATTAGFSDYRSVLDTMLGESVVDADGGSDGDDDYDSDGDYNPQADALVGSAAVAVAAGYDSSSSSSPTPVAFAPATAADAAAAAVAAAAASGLPPDAAIVLIGGMTHDTVWSHACPRRDGLVGCQ